MANSRSRLGFFSSFPPASPQRSQPQKFDGQMNCGRESFAVVSGHFGTKRPLINGVDTRRSLFNVFLFFSLLLFLDNHSHTHKNTTRVCLCRWGSGCRAANPAHTSCRSHIATSEKKDTIKHTCTQSAQKVSHVKHCSGRVKKKQ